MPFAQKMMQRRNFVISMRYELTVWESWSLTLSTAMRDGTGYISNTLKAKRPRKQKVGCLEEGLAELFER